MKKKIFQVTSYYPPYLGGMQNVVYIISHLLSRKGFKVTVLTSNYGGVKSSSEKNLLIKAYKSLQFAHTPIPFGMFFDLLKLKKEDIVHIHIAQAFIPELVYLASIVKGFNYIAQVHLDVDQSGKLGFLLKPYKKIILSRVLKRASSVIVLTNKDKEFMIAKYNIHQSNIVVIPNGVESKYFSRRRVNKRKVRNILFVGRLSSQKNIGVLIQAMSMIKNDIRLDIVGEGEDRKKLQNLTNSLNLENVHFHGEQKGKDLLKFYRTADLFILPSIKESMPLVLMEAMAEKIPIIAANIPQIRELIGSNGFLVDSAYPESYAKAIKLLLINYKLREKYINSSYERIKQFSWFQIINKFIQVYETVNICV